MLNRRKVDPHDNVINVIALLMLMSKFTQEHLMLMMAMLIVGISSNVKAT